MSSPVPPVDSANPRAVAFYTLGCKTNQLETATLAKTFAAAGWRIVPFDAPASLYVINTCTVTERADQEARRLVRRARLTQPGAPVAVTGCYAQVAPEQLAALDGVSYVVGNAEKDRLAALVDRLPAPSVPVIEVSEIDKSRFLMGATHAALDGDTERTRASLKIQDGCDYKCTYCIIWKARGPSRSLPVVDVAQQLSQLVAEGFKEVVLTGINIGQYQDDDTDLAGLLHVLGALPGDFRLRLTSLDPLEVTPALISAMAAYPQRICPHVHLSAQSAHDDTLKRMARRHHVQAFQQTCHALAKALPGVNIGLDIIVGFPGETPEAFDATYGVLKALPLGYLHVFRYSKRPGTPAASYGYSVSGREMKVRAERLQALGVQKNRAYRQQFLGQQVPVLVEQGGNKGLTPNYIRVSLRQPAPGNTIVPMRLLEVSGEDTWAQPVVI
jgi:threonylcarbamoyladenosine tRNA methylthiotransferase MtaB